jgi:alcohol dehydrogenase class IV
MIPTVALIDPKLTRSVPPEITAYTGLDALTQVIEPYVSRRANPLTDAVCREGIQRAARALSRAYENGDDLDAREDMAVAALCGGLALANAQLGAVHGFAGPFGGMYHAPHGAVCAALLPHVMTANIEILEARAPGHPALRRYDHVAQWLTGDASASARDGAVWVRELCLMLNIAPLSDFGLSEKDFDTLVEKAAQSSSMKGNPIELMPDELRAILRQAM